MVLQHASASTPLWRPSLAWVKSIASCSVTPCSLHSWHSPLHSHYWVVRTPCLLQCMTFHMHCCCFSLSGNTSMVPVQWPASPPAGIIPHWRTGLHLPAGLLLPSLWWFQGLGQYESFLPLLYAAAAILLSSTRKMSQLVEHEFFQFC